jgi:hypothetical protein
MGCLSAAVSFVDSFPWAVNIGPPDDICRWVFKNCGPGSARTDGSLAKSPKSLGLGGPNLSVFTLPSSNPAAAGSNHRKSPAAADGLYHLHSHLRGRRRKALAHRAPHPPRRVSRLALPFGPPRAPPPPPPVPRLALPRCLCRRALPSRGRARPLAQLAYVSFGSSRSHAFVCASAGGL